MEPVRRAEGDGEVPGVGKGWSGVVVVALNHNSSSCLRNCSRQTQRRAHKDRGSSLGTVLLPLLADLDDNVTICHDDDDDYHDEDDMSI